MQAIADWCMENELILNMKKGKTEFILFGTAKNVKSQKETINITYVYNTKLEIQVHFQYTALASLGCIIDLRLVAISRYKNNQTVSINLHHYYSYKYLGIIITPTLNPNATMKKCNSRLNLLKKI